MDGPVVSRPPERASSDAGELANEAWFEADVEEREKADDESADEESDREDRGEDSSAAEDDVDEEKDHQHSQGDAAAQNANQRFQECLHPVERGGGIGLRSDGVGTGCVQAEPL